MKNLILTAGILFFVTTSSRAQDSSFKRFGFLAGANFSHMNFSSAAQGLNIQTSWNTGITLGFLLAIPLADHLTLEPEYLFTQTGGTIKNIDTGYKFSYLSLPVLLRYKIGKIGIYAGPQFDLLIDAKRSVAGKSNKITHDTEERGINITAGIDFEIVPCFSVAARYVYGLNNVGLGQRSDVQEFKYEMAQITACIRF